LSKKGCFNKHGGFFHQDVGGSDKLTVTIFESEPDRSGVYYPVTARPASRKDRRHYREEQGGEEQ
jgi:hypothetical protein